jgi:DNA-binding GntR family transcriptional regulator
MTRLPAATLREALALANAGLAWPSAIDDMVVSGPAPSSLHGAVETADEAKAAIDEHTAIFSTVREQDEDRAASAMAAHMATATARVTGLNR